MANEKPAWATVVAKAWEDEGFKKRLLSDPIAVCREEGVEVPAGATVHVIEKNAEDLYVILPAKPSGELSEDQLVNIAAGTTGAHGSDLIMI